MSVFNSPKIDKLRLIYKKKDVSYEKRYEIHRRLKNRFPKSTTSPKAGYILHTFTPTKMVRRGADNGHNLQMPPEKLLYNVLNQITLKKPDTQDKIHDSIIHVTKDILLSFPVIDAIDYFSKLPYSYLEPEFVQSDGDPSLYLHYHYSPDTTGNMTFVIKFYDKCAEYYRQHKTYECQLYEPLAPEEIALVENAYSKEKNTLNLEPLNILRIEIEYHETQKILPIVKVLDSDAEMLSLTLILESLKAGKFYDALEKIFNNTLKKYVFSASETLESATAELSNIRKLACECLLNNPEYYQYKAVAGELGLTNQFSELDYIVRKVIPDSVIYQELQNALFNTTMKESIGVVIWSIRTCKSCSSIDLKHFILIYEVYIWDDS